MLTGRGVIVLIISVLLGCSAANAQDGATPHWRALTAIDVGAAHRMLLEDHPGAAPEVGDDAFRKRLADAYALASSRAARVDSFEGYTATLAGFAAAMGDKHIWSRPIYGPDTRNWPGIIIGLQGDDWVVVDEKEATDEAPLKGATLLSCDGIPALRLAEERLGGFRIFWPIHAQRVQRAYWLLLDDGNPFLKRPERCVFSQSGSTREVTLNWRPIRRTELGERLSKIPTSGSAGFGVRKVGDGYWIGIESFSSAAQPVVEEVRAKAAELRKAPYVVLDLRGNDGGSSHFGRLVANAVLGEAYVDARLGSRRQEGGCPKVWRISDRNVARLESYKARIGPQLGPEAVAMFTQELDTVLAAKAAGRPFSGAPTCAGRASSASLEQAPAAPEIGGRLVLLTDNACFSSCLLVTDEFRRLGALHVGQTTDANTNYMEVREDELPSGLSAFSTLQAVGPELPAQIGPFVPEVRYPADIADTAALERWLPTVLE